LRNLLFDLTLALAQRGFDQSAMVLQREVRSQQGHGRECHRAVSQPFSDEREHAYRTSGFDAMVGGTF